VLVIGCLLGVPITGNTGENPGRPRRCDQVILGSAYLSAIVTPRQGEGMTRRPDASELGSQKTCQRVPRGVLRGTVASAKTDSKESFSALRENSLPRELASLY
jgi:hypothetical protein